MKQRFKKCASLITAALILLTLAPSICSRKSVAANKHYPEKWSQYNFDCEVDGTSYKNNGYYIAPNGDGKYPVLVYTHGRGDNKYIISNLIPLLERWTEMGYMDEMVVIVPSIKEKNSGEEFLCFQQFAVDSPNGRNEYEGKNLIRKILSGENFDGKVDTKVPIHFTGYSLGAAVSLAMSVYDSEHCYNIGAFSPANAFYLGDGKYGYVNYAKDIKVADGANIYISYGEGEDQVYKDSAVKYEKLLKENNEKVNITFKTMDKSYGFHHHKLFTAELFTYLYYRKTGVIPDDELITAAINITSPVTETPAKPTITDAPEDPDGPTVTPSAPTITEAPDGPTTAPAKPTITEAPDGPTTAPVKPTITEAPNGPTTAPVKPTVSTAPTDEPSTKPVENPSASPSVTHSATPSVTPEVTGKPGADKTLQTVIGKITYKVTSNKSATVASADKTIRTASIKSGVKIGGKTYKVTSIEAGVFENCKKLTKVSGGSNVESIGKRAFSGCKYLKSFSITSKSLKSIGSNAFKGDKTLKTIKLTKTTALTAKGVKNALKGSSVKTVDVGRKQVKSCRKFFTKKNAGAKVTVK